MIRKLLLALLTPSYDQLVNRANREMHTFHLLKYKNFAAASVHRTRANTLLAHAAQMKRDH